MPQTTFEVDGADGGVECDEWCRKRSVPYIILDDAIGAGGIVDPIVGVQRLWYTDLVVMPLAVRIRVPERVCAAH